MSGLWNTPVRQLTPEEKAEQARRVRALRESPRPLLTDAERAKLGAEIKERTRPFRTPIRGSTLFERYP